MTNRGKGWYNDKPQHILAGHGIPTKARANIDKSDESYDYGIPKLKEGMKVPFDDESWKVGGGPLPKEFVLEFDLMDVTWDLVDEHPDLKQELEGYGTMGVYEDPYGELWEVLPYPQDDSYRIYKVNEEEDWW